MIDKDTLYDLYVNKKMTGEEIASLLKKRSHQTIYNWLAKYNIPRRGQQEAQKAVIPNKEELYELYKVQQLSIDTIANKMNSSESSISKFLKKYGIEIRDKTEKMAGWNKGTKMSETQRKKLSNHAKIRAGEKHPRYGARLSRETREKISSSLKGKYRKHLNPNWRNGGITPYRRIVMGQYEYSKWRKDVYERDNYICKFCGKKSNGDIQAHHISPVRISPERILDVNNGITLCNTCHRLIHGKEEKYIEQFEEIIHPPTL